ncbi:MAG TPA: OmpA family protein [Bacteroidales bacterium]|nr:MAG: Outer membrane porin F precursor [Bacteroidetes bacterium ADurb.Bin217]HPM11924.1 OmpA family protein [Bacteroidales bacterium]
MKRLFISISCILSCGLFSVHAQTDSVKQCVSSEKEYVVTPFDIWMRSNWGFSMTGGTNYFLGDISSNENLNLQSNFGIGVQKQLNDYIMWKGNFMQGRLSGEKAEFESGSVANLYFFAKITELSTVFQFDVLNMLQGPAERKGAIYAYAGAGIVDFRTQRKDLITKAVQESYGFDGIHLAAPTRELVVPVGMMFSYNVNKALAFNLDVSLRMVNSDKVDAYKANANNTIFADMYNYTGIGFSYKFGYKDCDYDGIPNRLDKCPGTPYGMPVDATGCITDKDNDGIADNDDACPEMAGPAFTKGCPDTDGDEIADKDDSCPFDKGSIEMKGCPDTDSDGIADKDDKCPKEKGKIELNGCPDSDNDGLADFEDRCPELFGPVVLNGCPDTDGDGIADIDDKCPKEAGLSKNLGCPEVKKEVLKIFERALTGIQFETGKDVILKTSFPILDQVVKVMKENPSYNLEINGHTDNVGNAQKNMELSNKRAIAVQNYMVSKGVEASRMKAQGFGDTMPIADNKTALGKSKNRRVEFKVVFQTITVE